jgi:alkanesulfonate monooxygenase SsuD/methylene tetrahydromethanopterin reductase-like flavin-dependent oxidoreductase (luciferase family)
MAATLDVISGGRLELGIGAGWWEMEYKAYGYDFPPVADRIRALEESVQIMKQLWTEPRANFAGKHYTITDALCEPKPVQKPSIPVWIGGAGPKMTLKVVAKHAEGWNTFLGPREDYELLLGALERHCEKADRDPSTVRKSLAVTLVIDSDSSKLDEKLATVARQRNTTPDGIRARTLAGTPDDVADQVLNIAEWGVDHIIIGVRAPYPLDDLSLFAQEVIPRVRKAGR